jgi:hypothetical protein
MSTTKGRKRRPDAGDPKTAPASPSIPWSAAAKDLDALKSALVTRTSTASGIAVLTRAVASDLGYKAYVRWLDHEIAGFADGFLGELLGVDEGDDLPARVRAYREQRGTVTITTRSTILEPLPYRLFFSQSLSQLDQLSHEYLASRSSVMVEIPTSQILQDGIRDWLERFQVQKMPVVFDYSVYSRILAGFRSELAGLVPEFEAVIRFNETMATVSEEKPSVNINIKAPVGNLNVHGTQGDVSVTQNVGTAIEEVEKAFASLLGPFSAQERELLQPLRRFLEEALLGAKSPEDTKTVVSGIVEKADKPGFVKKLVAFAKSLPVKLAEHALLGVLLHQGTALGFELLKQLPPIP